MGPRMTVRDALNSALSEEMARDEKVHGVNVGVAILRGGCGIVQVRDGVVAGVLVLPPLHGVALHEVAPEDSHEVTVLAALEDLMMEEVVCQPSALLPEHA